MIQNLKSKDIPEAVKTVSVPVFDAEGVRTGTMDAPTSYFWQTLDGSRFIGQATAGEKGIFEIDADAVEPTIQVNKYSVSGEFLGGPWRVKA